MLQNNEGQQRATLGCSASNHMSSDPGDEGTSSAKEGLPSLSLNPGTQAAIHGKILEKSFTLDFAEAGRAATVLRADTSCR